MREIPAGTTATYTVVPTRAHTAAAIGNTGVAAVSTPSILGFLEQASLLAIEAFQETGEVSVGAHVDLRHRRPAFPGRPVAAQATVIAVEGRRVTFAVEARQGDILVADGRYQRVVVAGEGFHARLPAAAVAPEPLTFWFDFHSPWSYLAALRLPALASRHGRPLRWVPIHVARLIEAIGGRKPLEANPAFVAWYRQDLMDWAAQAGVAIRYHPHFPLRPARALRAATQAIAAGRGESFVQAVMRAYWTENLDISDVDVLAALGASVGLVAADVAAATASPVAKAAVEAATVEAAARGVFGVPTIGIGGKLYFGNDRLDLLERHLAASADSAT